MTTPQHIAKHVREVHTGGNWTCVDLRATLADVTVDEAYTHYASFNTIAALLAHVNYYVRAVTAVLRGSPLLANDAESFNHAASCTQQEWEERVASAIKDGEDFATLIEQIPEAKLQVYLADEKYGTYYRNLHGIVEHMHYHLGQMVIMKRLVRTVK